MSTLTDDIRAATAAARDQLDIADAKADAIDAIPPSSPSSSGPLTWPTGQNCIDQSAFPYTFAIPAGDMDSGGFPEPYYSRSIAGTRTGMVYVFGDSILQACPASMISPFGISFAIGGQSARRCANRLASHDLSQAGAVVWLSGVNDLGNSTYYATYQDAINALHVIYEYINAWARGVWVIHHLLPCVAGSNPNWAIYNANVAAVNANINTICVNSAITIVTTDPAMLESDGSLKASCAAADGQHLSKLGVSLLSARIQAALTTRGVNP